MRVRESIERWARARGERVIEVSVLGADAATDDDTQKIAGYGRPVRVRLADAQGAQRDVVFHFATENQFGHDRRSDRALEQLLAFDTFGRIPRHVAALDVGAIARDGTLRSLADAGELYLVTGWADGRPYAEDLRRVARTGAATPLDLERVDTLARVLVELHAERLHGAAVYRRAVRDLVGSGEGIFGIVDGYPPDTEAAPPERLHAIERRCLDWRAKLCDRHERLRRTHGDFHPFNVLFDDGVGVTLLDASRGCAGDPADDVCAMAINYVFFAVEHPAAWPRGLGLLWHRFWARYVDGSGDRALYDVVAPFLAWRGLVVTNPSFYPRLSGGARDLLLRFVERVLAAPRFDPAWADELFA
jgi:hypothetical protein